MRRAVSNLDSSFDDSDTSDCDAWLEPLASLLLALQASVAGLEAIALDGDRAADIERWGVTKRCAKEIALVFEALGGAPASGRRVRLARDEDPLAELARAYDLALHAELPRAVRALIAEHRVLLASVPLGRALATAA